VKTLKKNMGRLKGAHGKADSSMLGVLTKNCRGGKGAHKPKRKQKIRKV